MFASFRASKVILGKVGTAASFGLGVHIGVRCADSHAGHRIAIEEARAFSFPDVDVRDVAETDLDVDKSDLLMGYSCFGKREITATREATLPGDRTMDCKTLMMKGRKYVKKATQSPVVQKLHISSNGDRASQLSEENKANCDKDEVEDNIRTMPAIPQQLVTQGAQSQIQCDKHTQSFHTPISVSIPAVEEKSLEIQGMQDTLHVSLDEEKDDQKDVLSSPKQQQHYRYVYETENLTWNDIVRDDHCPICDDLLAIPVVTACDHAFCGICLYRHVESKLGLYPIPCSLCRDRMEEGDSHIDLRRDGRIAENVGRFVELQKSRQGENWEGKSDYENWLSRREDYYISRYSRNEINVLEDDEVSEFGDNDDLPEVGSMQQFEGVNGSAVFLMGVAMTVIYCFLLAPSMKQSRGQSSLLKEMAMSFWR